MKIGVALASGRLVAALPASRIFESTGVADLRSAFAELRDAAGVQRATVSVALVPPFVDVRHIAVPPLREAERRRLLTRDAGRYFTGLREPQVVGSAVLMQRTLPVPLFVAAAPAALVAEIEAAVAAIGWVLAAIVPAHSAWAVEGDGHVIARQPHGTEVLRVKRGRVIERRRLRASDDIPPDLHDTVALDDPVATAARHAPAAVEPDLCSEARHATRVRRAHRVAAVLSGAALICAVLAAGTDYWGIGRELAAVRGRRAVVAPRVAAAIEARDSLSVMSRNLEALATLEATAPRWSAFLTDLAELLPRDAYVVALRGRGDSIVVEGVAGRAMGAFQALQVAPRVTAVRAEAPIRQEVGKDGTMREQFVLSVRLRSVP